MKATRLTAVLLVVLMCIGTGSAMAEIRPGAMEITPFLGGYTFEGDQNLENGWTLGLGLGYHFTRNWGAEAAFHYINTETDPGGVDVDGYLYRVEALYHFFPQNRLVPFLAAGIGGITLDPDAGTSDSDFLVNYGGGVKYFLNDNIALRADIRHVIPFDDIQNNLLYTIGVTFLFGGKKAMPVAAKTAPAEKPAPVTKAEAAPPAPSPATPAAAPARIDTDGDGVYDDEDRCPSTPPNVTVNNLGCPLDSDSDGVFDYLDKCPQTPLDLKVDRDGCPIPKKKTTTISLLIEFDVDKTFIKPIYRDKIKEVADFMETHPNSTAVIEGHTDSTASEAYNMDLSRRRAESVRDYLVNNFGIASEKLTLEWFGESRPVASNATAEGRQRNRRVVAVIVTITEEFEKK